MRFHPAALVLAVALATTAAGQTSKTLTTAIKILVGAAAAESIANAADAKAQYDENKAVVERLKAQGVDPREGAIYTLRLTMNGNADALYWADIFSKPDIFIIVAVEGEAPLMLPDVVNEYSGQPLLQRLLRKKIAPGRKVVLWVMDDDSTSNDVWNHLLQTRLDVQAGGTLVCSGVPVALSASGAVQLLGTNRSIDAADFVAYAEFTVPQTTEHWVADGTLHDANRQAVGKLGFDEFWTANAAEYDAAIARESASRHGIILWSGIAVACILVFGGLVLKKDGPTNNSPTGDKKPMDA